MLGCLKYDQFFAVVILEMLRQDIILLCFFFYPFLLSLIYIYFFFTARKLLAGIRDVTNDAIVHASHFDRIEGAFTAIPLL